MKFIGMVVFMATVLAVAGAARSPQRGRSGEARASASAPRGTQPPEVKRAADPKPAAARPTLFKLQAEALGPRVKTEGQGRAEFVGQFTDAQGKRSAVEITQQWPDLIEARGIRPNGQALKFDGQRVALPLAQAEAAFLESFTADTVEGLLEAERNGAAVRGLGFDFKAKGETPDRPELHFDIYQVTLTSKTRPDGATLTKLYWFESNTHLLLRTTYTDGETKVETRFQDWGTADGSRYPARVERYENGARVFAFSAASVKAGPKSDAAAFR